MKEFKIQMADIPVHAYPLTKPTFVSLILMPKNAHHQKMTARVYYESCHVLCGSRKYPLYHPHPLGWFFGLSSPTPGIPVQLHTSLQKFGF